MKVFMVVFDWSTTDNEDIEIKLFDSYEKALKHFNQTIKNEMDPEMSWVASEAFDKNGNIAEGFTLDSNCDEEGEHNLYWRVVDCYDYYRHDFLELRQVEVN